MILGWRAGMFAHHIEGTRSVAGFNGFFDDQVLAVTDNDPVQRPVNPTSCQHFANTAFRHHLQSAQAVLDKRVVASLHDCPMKDQVGNSKRLDCLVVDDTPGDDGTCGLDRLVKSLSV